MGQYDDIIHLPHHVSARHPQMPASDRAAQFSPFAALTGYEAAIAETARLTDRKPELDESKKEELDIKLQLIREHLSMKPQAAITYFVPDSRKEGGSYFQVTGTVKKIEDREHRIIMENGTSIPFHDIYEIKGSVAENMDEIL